MTPAASSLPPLPPPPPPLGRASDATDRHAPGTARGRRTLLVVVVVLALVAVGAVRWFGGSGGPGHDADAAGPHPATTPSGSAQPAAQVVPVPDSLDPSTLGGFLVHQTTQDDETDQRFVSTVSVRGDASLGHELDAIADANVRRYERDIAGSRDRRGELNVSWEPVVAAGRVLAVRLVSYVYTGGAHGVTTTQSVYSDLGDGRSWRSADLVAHPERLARYVHDAATTAGLDVTGTPPVSRDVVQDVRLDGDGGLTAVLPQGAVGPQSAGVVAVRLTPAAAREVLSDVGRSLAQAVEAGERFVGVPGSSATTTTTLAPTRTATPGPAQTGSGAPTTAAPSGTPQPANVDCRHKRCVALTFDDGPGPYTAKLLTELAAKDVHATFFLVGQNVAARPGLVRAELAAGHAIGNHSWNHPDLSRLDAKQVASQLDRTDAAIRKATGGVGTQLVRPPYGATGPTVTKALQARGDAAILWDVDTEDWKNRDAKKTTANLLREVRPGSIVLMHDIHPTTVEAVPGIIDALRARGYTLVTVPQLLGGAPKAGSTHFAR